MMSNNSQTGQEIERILEQALELKDKGYSVLRILEMFPLYQEELKEVFLIATALEKHKEDLIPSKELLSSIVLRVELAEQDVTEKSNDRFSYRGAIKGRPSLIGLISQVREAIKASKLRIAVPVTIILIAAITTAGYGFRKIAPGHIGGQEQNENIDDALQAFIKDLPEESTTFEDEGGDVSLVGAGANELSELDQIYDENKF